MSITQISRIQHRRGRKNTATGFPQLASGEFGWAIDTQELYIGNGSVSEGAPYVGNTEILTEHSDLLEYNKVYQYKKPDPTIQTGINPATPTTRSLQDRLDDFVSVKSFGAIGDGFTDDTIAIQRAIDSLFLNDANKTNPQSRVTLYFDPGEYIITDELKIPPYSHLIGTGIDGVILKLTTNNFKSIFRFVDGNSSAGNYTDFNSMVFLQRPRNIIIQGMTLETNDVNSIVLLDNADTVIFNYVKFKGVYTNSSSPIDAGDVNQSGLRLRSASGIFRPENIQFKSCIWENTGYGVFSDSDHNSISFNDCAFYQLFDGLNVGGGVYGSINCKITNSYFDLIDRHALWIKLGYGNISTANNFMNVGNSSSGYANAIFSIIKFDTENNQSYNDYFDRSTNLKNQDLFGNIAFKPNVESTSLVTDNTGYKKILNETVAGATEFFRFPVTDSAIYNINYAINKTTSGTAIRTGHLIISANVLDDICHVQDNYGYTGSNTVENIVFSATLEDYNADSIKDTLVLLVVNPSGNGVGTVNYSYTSLTV
jgi:hypothetical protein